MNPYKMNEDDKHYLLRFSGFVDRNYTTIRDDLTLSVKCYESKETKKRYTPEKVLEHFIEFLKDRAG